MLALASCSVGFVFPYLSKKNGIREIGLTLSGHADLEDVYFPRLFVVYSSSDVMKASADKVEQFRLGKTKLQGFFVGQAVALSGGTVDPS
ncbi:aspartyl/glutamyl-tRNA(Asn/Gln) amidotransferase, B subunit [Ectocarpus siliculosus]|uniref:Aspartyl/glutamyl-tRNA(Asn/Gln) amidotransferase, B subunit n=1 Tax=Ectocarpus siliculosus TaxID=2880 RepID=D7FYG3_ECTSI|nr:aspartyl/glutamyl-tRNA(Asn/Gln) amidotransferase, B subunit [Ectocarpus siliculosus]|eukprot:CBJ32505.1 aspartyl/glutamyl-tRNA(Asn/Gln) amidotransferase, B subunit [Ectocarpus siliculosus]